LQPTIQLVAGLGNPGDEYARTRHNAGFWLVDLLAERQGARLAAARKFKGEAGETTLAGHAFHLLKPRTYMNNSGAAVAAMASFYKVPPERIMVVHDEIDLPPGVARLKRGGGAGGHNGLRDIIAALGDQAGFVRLRIGVGRPQHSADVIDFVLKPPPAAERRLIDEAIDRALEALPLAVGGELEKAMHRLHTV
jgi:PTH1 family peptidyl-tRNA hydrolase